MQARRRSQFELSGERDSWVTVCDVFERTDSGARSRQHVYDSPFAPHCTSMPSTRITIASNARQTTRSVVLIPASPPSDLFDSVIDLARKKLRLKGKRVFREGGVEISQGELDTSAINNDESVPHGSSHWPLR